MAIRSSLPAGASGSTIASDMANRKRYKRRPGTTVVAVRLALDTAGFSYQKWGGTQRCRPGDWVVSNAGDTYTVGADIFARTYQEVRRGEYEKVARVWAERATQDGELRTHEGISAFRAGDYLVFEEADGHDGYAVEAAIFDSLYAAEDDS